MNMIDNYRAAELAASAAFDAEVAGHGSDLDAKYPRHEDGSADFETAPVIRCRCGWEPSRPTMPKASKNRAVGLHVAAAEKRASKAWSRAYEAKLVELGAR